MLVRYRNGAEKVYIQYGYILILPATRATLHVIYNRLRSNDADVYSFTDVDMPDMGRASRKLSIEFILMHCKGTCP